jgi:hypothetical protein
MSVAIIEISPHRNGWKVFESPGVEPVFPDKGQASITLKTARTFAQVRFAFLIQATVSNAPSC